MKTYQIQDALYKFEWFDELGKILAEFDSCVRGVQQRLDRIRLCRQAPSTNRCDDAHCWGDVDVVVGSDAYGGDAEALDAAELGSTKPAVGPVVAGEATFVVVAAFVVVAEEKVALGLAEEWAGETLGD